VKKKKNRRRRKKEEERYTNTLSSPPAPNWIGEFVVCVCACTTLSLIVLTEDQGRAKAFLTGRRGERNSLPQTSRVLAWCCPRIMGESVREGERGGKKSQKKVFSPLCPTTVTRIPYRKKKRNWEENFAGYRSGHKFSPLDPPSPLLFHSSSWKGERGKKKIS